MAETIKEIREWKAESGFPVQSVLGEETYGSYAGFQIETTEQVVTLAINDDPACCETWGYFLTEDDVAKFIGAELREIKITDTNRSTHTFDDGKWDDENNHSLDAGGVLFVDLVTDRGTLQFVAYNAHNGYYGHEAKIHSQQLEHAVTL